MSLLEEIQRLQFSDKPAAERLLIGFVRETFNLDVTAVELRPLAVSLNSFNGFVTLTDGQRLFFKTHTESNGVIGEYYNASMLAEAGYPVLQPIMQSTEAGKQFLIYPVIEDPSVFDIAHEIIEGRSDRQADLEHAQNAADNRLLDIYLHTLKWQSAEDAAKAAVHQLFYHRLTGGRLEAFYGERQSIAVWGIDAVETLPMSVVRQLRWTINGQVYDETLDDIIAHAVRLLNPLQSGVSIIGHGDAHNGNVFLQGSGEGATLLYFDPAFAGQHDPLLDLTKPLFHNVFASWMYFPQETAERLTIRLQQETDGWSVTHDFPPHPVREMFLQSKTQRVLIPILRELKARGWLREDWRAYLKAALFCCPFLTMNLTDRSKFPPAISLLGLAMAVEMGSESTGVRSRIDNMLDEVEKALV